MPTSDALGHCRSHQPEKLVPALLEVRMRRHRKASARSEPGRDADTWVVRLCLIAAAKTTRLTRTVRTPQSLTLAWTFHHG